MAHTRSCLAAFLLALSLTVQASPWAKFETPTPGPANAIGGAGNGCLIGAAALPAEGRGYVSIRRQRNRYHGHPELVRLIEELGRIVDDHGRWIMPVGDLSQPRGGPMPSSHRSHQNGLDADIWLSVALSATAANRDFPEGDDPLSMVAGNGLEVSAAWGEPQAFLIKAVAQDKRVDRLFVNAAIKKALCEKTVGDRAWLRKVRPWWGHDAHLHLRLKCPQDSADCTPQPPLPAGEGCGGELAWWFSDEARKPAKNGEARALPVLPEACQLLLPNP